MTNELILDRYLSNSRERAARQIAALRHEYPAPRFDVQFSQHAMDGMDRAYSVQIFERIESWIYAAAEEYLRQAHPDLLTAMIDELAAIIAKHQPAHEFDRINHGPFEHPVSEPVNQVEYAEAILRNAIRHIRRAPDSLGWALTKPDQHAVEILLRRINDIHVSE